MAKLHVNVFVTVKVSDPNDDDEIREALQEQLSSIIDTDIGELEYEIDYNEDDEE